MAKPPQQFRRLAGILSGSMAAQLVTIASFPLLARLYPPSDFAAFGVYTAIVSIASVVLTFRADRMLLFVERTSDVGALLSTYIVMLGFGAAICVGLSLIFGGLLPAYSITVLLLSTIAAVILSISNVMVGFRTRSMDTQGIVVSQFVRNIFTVAVQLSLAVWSSTSYGLLVGALMGTFMALIFLVLRELSVGKVLLSALSGVRVHHFSVDEARSFIWASGQAGLNAISNNLPVMLVTAVLPAATAGLFVLADRLARLPINIVSNNIRNYVAMMMRGQSGPNMAFAYRFSLLAGAASFGCLLVLAVGQREIFSAVFGCEWIGAGSITAILFSIVVANFLTLPFQAYLMSLREYRRLFLLEILTLGGRASALFLCIQFGGSVVQIAAVTAVVACFYYGALLAVFYGSISRSRSL